MELKGEAYSDDNGQTYKQPNSDPFTGDKTIVETKPHFYEWATATTGMLAVSRKQRSTFRNYVAAETAAPVIACAAGKGPLDELDFQFAGVVRSNSVRTMDDGAGPTTDEYFTLTIGGPATILNNSASVIHAGDTISWTFYSEDKANTGRRAAHGSVRRIGIKVADFHDECKIGRVRRRLWRRPSPSMCPPPATDDALVLRFRCRRSTLRSLASRLMYESAVNKHASARHVARPRLRTCTHPPHLAPPQIIVQL